MPEIKERTIDVLNIYMRLPSGDEIHCGDVAIAQRFRPTFEIQSDFRYTEEYLKHQEAIPLDSELPLQPGIIRARKNPFAQHIGLFKFLEDAMPESWGRRVLSKYFDVKLKDLSVADSLHLLGRSTLGAVFFKKNAESEVSKSILELIIEKPDELIRVGRNCNYLEAHIDDALDAKVLHDALAGAGIGGARPKVAALVNGERAIIKFQSEMDVANQPKLEYAAMLFAKKCGVDVATPTLFEAGDFSALSTKRFDIAKDGTRYHVSTVSALTSDSINAYSEIGDLLREHSSATEKEQNLKQLELQMLSNIILGNTDDHLKNFSILQRKDEFKLAPAYDIVPQYQSASRASSQYLSVGSTGEGWLDRIVDEIGKINPAEKTSALQRVFDFLDTAEKNATIFDRASVDCEITQKTKQRVLQTIADIRENKHDLAMTQSTAKKELSEIRGKRV